MPCFLRKGSISWVNCSKGPSLRSTYNTHYESVSFIYRLKLNWGSNGYDWQMIPIDVEEKYGFINKPGININENNQN